MPRRSRTTRRPTTCPCGTGKPYAECCGPLHGGEGKASTAEALMRSRYSAFAVGDADYLRRTWHPDTRPAHLDLTGDRRRWTGLDILATTGGTVLHSHGTVTFTAHYTDEHGAGSQTETSAFQRHQGEWVYIDALE